MGFTRAFDFSCCYGSWYCVACPAQATITSTDPDVNSSNAADTGGTPAVEPESLKASALSGPDAAAAGTGTTLLEQAPAVDRGDASTQLPQPPLAPADAPATVTTWLFDGGDVKHESAPIIEPAPTGWC